MMKTKNLLLLAALTTGATLGSLALAPSAQAIAIYNIDTTFSGTDDIGAINGTIIGSFTFEPNNQYTNVNIAVTGTGGAGDTSRYNYTAVTADVDASNTISNDRLFLDNGVTPQDNINFRELVLRFDTALTGTPGESVALNSTFSRVVRGTGTTNSSVTFPGSVSATAVPLETDALPIVGSALFMAGGLWWKKKRAGAKALDLSPTEAVKG